MTPMNAFERIVALLTEAKLPGRHFPATLLYNEGWMLRLVLDWFANRPPHDHPLSFAPGANWFSEALLPSQFFANRRGDPLAEGWTHADGVIGHVAIGEGALANTKLKPDATQFVVTEAKLSSPLSPGVKNAPDYDQAARNVACMAQVISETDLRPGEMTTIGFFVLAPESQIAAGIFSNEIRKASIRAKVIRRIESYSDPVIQSQKFSWFSSHFEPVLDIMRIDSISWEALISHIAECDTHYGIELQDFYAQCQRFNQTKGNVSA